MDDSIIRTRSLGVAAVGLPDQYADGEAAKVWQLYIGDKKKRTEEYRNWLVSLLKQQGCNTVLDVACGTGMVDSIYRTRSLGVAAVGLPDQYADGEAAKVWQLYIGDKKKRTEVYCSWLVTSNTVLDVACGTGNFRTHTPTPPQPHTHTPMFPLILYAFIVLSFALHP